ncbi:hypothetical protein DSL64_07080 [Dyadobacter luteus]|jgi:hypothetical protein|uniref:DUF2911 domain-containing protein n=1 Tax=Dyadobacter luteus TaxID=2259619 RepID=A0A3D8YDS9_9BACT|nr:DUF2911 domain-containing protein [Dyadobacter luteus]REA62680.1 hypothetical protein DSL64_07080 [Dyadobacter luteus]
MKKSLVFTLALWIFQCHVLLAQEDKSKRPSPPAVAEQTVNGTTINISYSQPFVKGRDVWDPAGQVAPFGKIWRTGANETTSITFSNDVQLEGKAVAKGNYALFTIPGEKQWTIILNKTIKWGAFSYKEDEDILRVTVPAKKVKSFQEKFNITISPKGIISLNWAELKVEFKIITPKGTASKGVGHAKSAVRTINLVQIAKQSGYKLEGRTVKVLPDDQGVRLDERPESGGGIAWLPDTEFSEGTIEVDIRGKDVLQGSFVGIAFHGSGAKDYDAIYFRPFNFQTTDPVRRIHAVQYISLPNYDWPLLRKDFPDQYEKGINPAPQANDWVHARILVEKDSVHVYVNNNPEPSLTVGLLNKRHKGSVGLWVGAGSGGDFANLKISR